MAAPRRGAKGICGLLAVLGLVLFAQAAAGDAPLFDNVPAPSPVEATSSSGATVSWTDPTATDGSPVDCEPGSGSTFSIGTTSVTCTATNPDTSETANVSFNVVVQDTTAPDVSVPGTQTVEAAGPSGATATFSASASDTVDGSLTATCAPSSGSTFALGSTQVTCDATDNHGNHGSASFSVVVQDTQAPSLTVPSDISTPAIGAGGAAVPYSVSATDTVDSSPSISCSPASGSTFAVGQTTVSCSATDDSGNMANGSFHVTVTDGVGPVVTVPGTITAEATGPGGAAVTFSASANDDVSGSVAAGCSPSSGSTFSIGTTSVTCTAHDGAGNTGSASFNVTVRDTTAPVLTVPATVTKEAQSADGAAVTFAATAADAVDGSVAVTCTPPSGSTFALGSTPVSCSAQDGHGNSATKGFTVQVVDTTPPELPVLPDIVAEADGPSGALVNYRVPTAVDRGEPVPGACGPTAGSLFPLGKTIVLCSATDAAGNHGSATFAITVVDTTKPTLNVPRPTTVSSNGAASIAASAPSVAAFLSAANARDLVDGTVQVTTNAPATLPVGTTTITFTAKDRSGNVATALSQITVSAGAVTPTPVDATPPGDVTRLKATPGDASVLLAWSPPTDDDFDHVTVARTASESRAAPVVVYSGSKRSFKDTGLTNGTEYRYVVVAFDRAGNASPGLVVRATPKAPLLTAPRDGATVTKPPVLAWRAAPNAAYYNVQLFRVTGGGLEGALSTGATKILSAWPQPPRLALATRWTYGGKKEQLLPGRYAWYVWPGVGAKSANRYGPLLGQSSFVVKAAKKPAKPVAKKKPPAKKKKPAPKKKR